CVAWSLPSVSRTEPEALASCITAKITLPLAECVSWLIRLEMPSRILVTSGLVCGENVICIFGTKPGCESKGTVARAVPLNALAAAALGERLLLKTCQLFS